MEPTNIPSLEPDIEVYDHARHFEMISAWDEPLDQAILDLGLVMPGICCVFVDRIGRGPVGYFHTMRANPLLPTVTRMRGIMELSERIVALAKAYGITKALLSTSKESLKRLWTEKYGLRFVHEAVIGGSL